MFKMTNSEGKPITGGQLFRKYLLNRCQEDFERGWVTKEAMAAAASTKALDDEAAKAANVKTKESGASASTLPLFTPLHPTNHIRAQVRTRLRLAHQWWIYLLMC
jgi:hypothetical protein